MKSFKRFTSLFLAFELFLSPIFSVLPVQAQETLKIVDRLPLTSERIVIQNDSRRAVNDELLIRYHSSVRSGDRDGFLNQNQLNRIRTYRSAKQFDRVQLPGGLNAADLASLIESYKADERVAFVEPNFILEGQAASAPNDPDFDKQWALNSLSVLDLWEESVGDPEVTIALLDSGIASHIDEPTHLLSGFDVLNQDPDPNDEHGHGTFLAGSVAAGYDNDKGISGICPGCSVLPVKVLNASAKGTYADVIEGIYYAVEQGADVINLSLGGYGYSAALHAAVKFAHDKGVILVAAAGNDGVSEPMYPAAFPEVISVNAVDSSAQVWNDSNTGETVNSSAPGVGIYGLDLGGGYTTKNGTSVAAAHVSALAGLLLSAGQTVTLATLADYLGDSTVVATVPNSYEPYEYPQVTGKRMGGLLLHNQLNLVYPQSYIDAFLQKQLGRLKELREASFSGYSYSAAESLTTATQGPGYTINPQVVLVMLELISGVVTDSRASDDRIHHAADVWDEYYWETMVRFPEFTLPDSESVRRSEYPANRFDYQVNALAAQLGFAQNCFSKSNNNQNGFRPQIYTQLSACDPSVIRFKDGSTLFTTASTNAESYAVMSTLASVTTNQREWRRWISGGEGSFAHLFEEWFGDPLNYTVTALEDDDTKIVPFLARKPFDKFNNAGTLARINSFYDHHEPNYSNFGNDGKMVHFLGEEINGASLTNCILGYNCYSDHDGVDYSTKTSALYAPADGTVFKLKVDGLAPEAYGNTVYLKHETENVHGNKIKYYSLYAHLQDGFKNVINKNVGDSIKVSDSIGNSGNTGSGSVGAHLHFGVRKIRPALETNNLAERHYVVDPYGWWGQEDEPTKLDPKDDWTDDAGWQGGGKEYYHTHSHWLWGDGNEKLEVDNEDVNFQYVKGGNTIWNEVSEGEGGTALYTFPTIASDYDMADVKTWAIWTPTITQSGKYQIQVHIPDHQPNGSDTSSEAIYRLYNSSSPTFITEYVIDQAANAGKWMNLGQEQYFDKNAKVSVVLTDIAKDASNANKVIWADAVSWVPTNGGGLKPDLVIVDDEFLELKKLHSTALDLYHTYEATLTVKNQGQGKVKEGKVCFQPSKGLTKFLCMGDGKIDELESGYSQTFVFTFWSVSDLTPDGDGDKVGTFKILDSSIYPEESNKNNNELKLFGKDFVSLESNVVWAADDPGGVDFTAATLSGVTIDPDTNELQFVIKAEEAGAGDTVIDIDGEMDDIKKLFLQALAVPSHKHWISLDHNPEYLEGGPLKQTPNSPEPFRQTDLASIMFIADVYLKEFWDVPFRIFRLQYWEDLVKASPLWPTLSSKDFNNYVFCPSRAAIIHGEVTGNATGNTVNVLDAQLAADSSNYEACYLLDFFGDLNDLSPADFEGLDELIQEFSDWYTQALIDRREEMAYRLNNDPEYADVRQAYQILSLAHWYKTLPRYNLPYADLIDSNNIDDIVINPPITDGEIDSLWKSLAMSWDIDDFYGNSESMYTNGGVSFGSSKVEVQGELTAEEEALIATVTEEKVAVEKDGDYYLYGGSIPWDQAELSPGVITISPSPFITGESLNIQATVMNTGMQDSGAFTVKFYREFMDSIGEPIKILITSKTVDNLSTFDETTIDFNWIPPQAGEQKIVMEVDSQKEVVELDDENNIFSKTISVASNLPKATITQPIHGQSVKNKNVKFSGYAFDAKTTSFEPEKVKWSSANKDGFLGDGFSIEVPVLTPGVHDIVLEVTNEDGFKNMDQITLYVTPPEFPLVSIISPVQGQEVSSHILHTLTGTAKDVEDGDLCDVAVWSSDLDGALGVGCSLETELSVGTHVLTLAAENLSKLESQTSVQVVVQPGLPTLVVSPAVIGVSQFQHQPFALQATASDIQDGDLAAKVTWSSSIDGALELDEDSSVLLSPGTHTITASVVDSHGLSAQQSFEVTSNFTPPQVNITSPSNGQEFTYGADVKFVGVGTDVQDGTITGTNYEWNSSVQGWLGAISSLTVDDLSPGTHVITLSVTDSDGQTTISDPVEIFIDAGQPAASITAPVDGESFFFAQPILFQGAGDDPEEGDLIGEQLVWESSIDGPIGTGETFSLNDLSVGEHIIRLTVTDSENWNDKEEIAITVEPPHAPEVAILSPTTGSSHVHGDSVKLKALATDVEDGNLSGDSVSWNSDLDGDLGNTTTLTLTTLSVGTHTLTFTATDSLGESTKASVTISVDPAPPVASITAPADGTIFTTDESVILEGSGTDLEDGELTGTSLSWTSDSDGILGTGSPLILDDLSVGTHIITLAATDSTLAQTTSDPITLIVQDSSTTLLNTFDDGDAIKTLNFGLNGGDQMVYLEIPKSVTVSNAQLSVSGLQYGNLHFIDSGQLLDNSYSYDAALGDLDGDGDLDIFNAKYSTNAANTVWFNNGDGIFTNSGQALGDANSFNVELGDLDGDGDLDAFVGNNEYEAEANTVWFNDGNGVFIDSGQALGAGRTQGVALGDLDDDGDLDAFVTNSKNGPSGPNKVWLNDGDGFFADSGQLLSDFNSYEVDLGDVDGDGDLDAFVANRGGPNGPPSSRLWLNNGSGIFASSAQDFPEFESIALADFDSDNDLDVVFGAGQGNTNALWLNNGNGFFIDTNQCLDSPCVDSVGTNALDVGDLDSDGDMDIVFSRDDEHSDSIWMNDGSGNFTYFDQQLSYTPSTVNGRTVIIELGDLNGDGSLDVYQGLRENNKIWLNAFSDFPKNSSLTLNIGDPDAAVFEPVREYNTLIDGQSRPAYVEGIHFAGPLLVDIDSDQKLDLFIPADNGKFFYYHNEGTVQVPDWQFVTDQLVPNPSPATEIHADFSDLDNDGDLDLLVGLDNGKIIHYENTGSKFDPDFTYVTGNYADIDLGFFARPDFADIDADGDEDLFLLYDSSGGGDNVPGLAYYRRDGFEANGEVNWVLVTDDYAGISAAYGDLDFADLDKDGDLDLLVGKDLGQISYYRNDGTPQEANFNLISSKFQNIDVDTFAAPGLGDFNGDGFVDMMVGNWGGNNYVYQGGVGSTMSFDHFFPIKSVNDYARTLFADLDSDGDSDLFLYDSYQGDLVLYENQGSASQPDWHLIGTDCLNPVDQACTSEIVDSTFVSKAYLTNVEYFDDGVPAFIDLDADGDLDVYDGYQGIHFNVGSASNPIFSFTNIKSLMPGFDPDHYLSRLIFVDVDLDGDYDFMEVPTYLDYFENVGGPTDPSFVHNQDKYGNVYIDQFMPQLIDLDKDGDLDFVKEIAYGSGGLIYYENLSSDPNNPDFELVSNKYGGISEPVIPYFFDIDADGDYDLFGGDEYGGVRFWSNETGFEFPFWSYNGEFKTTQTTSDFSAKLNDYLVSYEGNEDMVKIPITVHSDTAGILQLSNVNVQYQSLDVEKPVISNASISPNPVNLGQSFTVSAIVTDNDALESVEVTYNDQTYSLTSSGGNEYSKVIAAVGSGAQELTLTATDASGLSTTETLVLEVVALGVDLAVLDDEVEVETDNVIEGDDVNVGATIHNFGNQSVSDVSVVLKVGDEVVDEAVVSLSASSQTPVNLAWVAEAGDHTLTIHIDPESSVIEQSKSNNTVNVDLTVADGTAPLIENVTFTPDPVTHESEFTLAVSASDSAGVVSVNVEWMGENFDLSLNPETELYEAILTAEEVGEHSVILTAQDASGLVSTQTSFVEVIALDPNLKTSSFDIAFGDENLIPGKPTTVSLIVHNTGGTDVTGAVVRFSDSVNAPVEKIADVLVNAQADVSFEWTPKVGQNILNFEVDPDNAIDELSEEDNIASTTVTTQVSAPPTLSDLSASPNPVTAGEDFDLSVKVQDQLEVTQVQAFWNFGTYDLTLNAGTGLYEATLPAGSAAGEANVLLKATNVSGASVEAVLPVIVNPNTPEFSISALTITPQPVDLAAMSTITATLENTGAKDSDEVIAGFTVDGALVSTQSVDLPAGESVAVNFEWWPELDPGPHQFGVVVDPDGLTAEDDETNNLKEQTVQVIDTIAPILHSVTFDEVIYQDGPILISVEASDNVAVETVKAQLSNQPTVLTFDEADGLYHGTLTAPPFAGDFLLKATVVDSSGLSDSFTQTITVHAQQADLAIDNFDVLITPSQLIEGQSATVDFEVTNQGGSNAVDVPIVVTAGGQTIWQTTTDLAKGKIKSFTADWNPIYGDQDLIVNVDATGVIPESDESNNSVTKSIYVADLTAPPAPQPQVNPNVWTDQLPFEVTWLPVSDLQGIDEYQYRINQGDWQSVGLETNVILDDLNDGLNAISVRAKDSVGNFSTPGVAFAQLDTIVPDAPVVSELHVGDFWSDHDSPFLTWQNPADAGSGVTHFLAQIDDNTPENIDNTLQWHPTLGSGVHTLKVKSVDALGHQSPWSNIITVSLDLDAPEAPVINSTSHPDPNVWVSNNTANFGWTTPQDLSGIDGYFYLLDKKPDTAMDQTAWWHESNELTMTTLPTMDEKDQPIPDGEWFLHVGAQDSVGHIGLSAHFPLKIDTTPPFSTVAPLSNLPDSAPYRVAIDSVDLHSGVKQIFHRLNGGPWVEDHRVMIPNANSHLLEYYAVDHAGNTEPIQTMPIPALDLIPDVFMQVESFDSGAFIDHSTRYFVPDPVLVGTTVELTFSIFNEGEDPLVLIGQLPVSVTNESFDSFTLFGPPTKNIIPPLSGVTFSVRFNPTEAGLHSAMVEIANVSDTNPYKFMIYADAVSPTEVQTP